MLDEVLRNSLQGLLAGSIYSLGALSLTISYSVTRIANFAVSEYVTIGAYTATIVTIGGFDPFLALFLAMLVSSILALGVDESVYKPLYRRGSSPLQLLIASIGVMLLIRYLWSIYADYSDMLFLSSRYNITPIAYIMGSPITNLHILSLGFLGITSISLYMFRHRTMVGKAMRALASNPELASASGIPVWRVRRITWIVSGLLAGAMGALWAFYTSINTETGWRLLLWIFASSIIGGIRSIPLTIAGGFIIGFSENLGMWFFNRFFGLDTAYKPIIAYLAIATALLVGRSRLLGR
ncbi:MAG TPA: branched-chain amino acid ABC transporter permease [Sulfolobales archaeon]|nr:branched-chain amino acid ABC transporter permease [Sulfolobales archaeon]